jgi:hypothetical protein
MATFFKNKLQSNIGTTELEIIDVETNSRVTVIGLSLTNMTDNPTLASIRVVNTATEPDESAYYIKDVLVPPNQSLRVINGGEKLVLAGDMKVFVQASVANSLDLVASYVEII